eukprot:c23448_g1_i3 orf=72-1130(+)
MTWMISTSCVCFCTAPSSPLKAFRFQISASTMAGVLQLVTSPFAIATPVLLSSCSDISVIPSPSASAGCLPKYEAYLMPEPARWSRSRGFVRRNLAAVRCEATVGATPSGPGLQYAKEMERIAAKEALLLAIKDAGGAYGIKVENADGVAPIDVNERIINLERLNPTLRPTTSLLLEGLWQFKWLGDRSAFLVVARSLLQRIPSTLASFEEPNLLILDGCANATASAKILNTIGSNVTLTSRLTVEGPLRLKEEYVEGLLATPSIEECAIPSQLKGAYQQFLAAFARIPDPVKETLANGLKISLSFYHCQGGGGSCGISENVPSLLAVCRMCNSQKSCIGMISKKLLFSWDI